MYALNLLQKSAATAVVLGLLLMYHPNSAFAASGGRMGGRSFSSSSSSSSKSRSTTSASYYTSYRSRSCASYSTPYKSCSSTSASYYTPYKSRSSTSASYYTPYKSRSSACASYYISFPVDALIVLVVGIIVIILVASFFDQEDREKTSVLKLQVGLLGSARSLQKDLNWIAETADTSTKKGLHHVLTETVLAMLRHPDYFVSAYSSVSHNFEYCLYLFKHWDFYQHLPDLILPINKIDIKSSTEKGEEGFNKLSIEERGKFDEETLVNINNIKKKSSTTTKKADGFSSEYLVVTVLVAIRGELVLPSINNSQDLKEALEKVSSISSSATLAVEVLWTPQKEDDTLSKDELLQDYPLLQPLEDLRSSKM